MAVTGDFTRLHQLRERIRAVAAGGARKELIGALRDETNAQVVACFAQKRDPYGRPWPPRRRPSAEIVRRFGLLDSDLNHPLLDKTGALINSVQTRALAIAVKVTMLGYGVFHWQPDRPGQRLPQRAMLPTKRQGLGPIWADAFLRVSGRVARAFMRAV